MRLIAQAPYGGADLFDCLSACEAMRPGDPASWLTEWRALAERVENDGRGRDVVRRRARGRRRADEELLARLALVEAGRTGRRRRELPAHHVEGAHGGEGGCDAGARDERTKCRPPSSTS